MNTISIDEMGKDDLHAACKKAGISYGKMSNLQMREALKAVPAEAPAREVAAVEPVVTTLQVEAEAQPVAPAAAASAVAAAPKPKDQRNGVTRPGPGKCLDVWNAIDALIAEDTEVTFAAIKEKLPNHADATIRTQRQRHKTWSAI